MSSSYEKAAEAAAVIKSKSPWQIKTLVILGSGLAAFAEKLSESITINYNEIPYFPQPTVIGHVGKMVLGLCQGVPLAVMAGRFHYYEGYSMEEVSFPVRVAALAGIKTLIVTNASGGINSDFQPGDLMIIDDHINLIGANPLRGRNDERYGERFPDMTEVYCPKLRKIADQEGKALGLRIQHGVYTALAGPNYETPAEVRMLRVLGSDAVGMSTVPETIVAKQMGVKVLGISCIANLGAGIKEGTLDHKEVLETSALTSKNFIELLERVVPKIDALDK
jgi:purine-nucleoside phosphorylase